MLIHEQHRATTARRAPAPVVAREVGWKGARGPNAEQRRTEAEGRGVERIPIDGIKGAGLPSRAIVVMPSQLSEAASIDVLLHLHGFTPGYATGDDLGVYKIEAQMAAAGKELLGILPQGSDHSDFNGAKNAGKAFDADAFIAAVFARLTAEGYGVPAPGRVIMSSHSGGDQPLSETLKSKPPEKLAGLFLFDTMIASAFGGAVWSYVDGRIGAELEHLRQMKLADPESLAVEAQMATWIQQNGFRLMVVYRKGGAYQAAAKAIEGNLDARFKAFEKEFGALVFSSMRDHYAVHEVTETTRIQHMDVLAGDDALRNAIETLPTTEALEGVPREPEPGRALDGMDTPQLMRLASYAGNRAMAAAPRAGAGAGRAAGRHRESDGDGALGPDDAAARVPQGRVRRPSRRLEGRRLGGRQEGRQRRRLVRRRARQGDQARRAGRPDARGARRRLLPAERYQEGRGPGGDRRHQARLQPLEPVVHGRELEKVGIDPAKAADMTTATMLGQSIQVNKLVLPTVKKTNEYFASSKLTDAERAEVTASIMSMGGYNRRTTTAGAFSNHSIGCAVDINALLATGQNDHVLKGDKAQARRMELFQHVVRRESSFSTFDVWAETDSKKLARGQPPLQLPLPAVPVRAARRRRGR